MIRLTISTENCFRSTNSSSLSRTKSSMIQRCRWTRTVSDKRFFRLSHGSVRSGSPRVTATRAKPNVTWTFGGWSCFLSFLSFGHHTVRWGHHE